MFEAILPRIMSMTAHTNLAVQVGRNYMEHIKELKGILNLDQSVPTEPLIFLKSGSCVLPPPQPSKAHNNPQELPLPVHWSNDIQHEVGPNKQRC